MKYSDDLMTDEELDDPGDEYPTRRPGHAGQGAEAEMLLRRVSDLIASARPVLLSASVMINKDEVLDLLDDAIERLPEELRAARWLLKEREELQLNGRKRTLRLLEHHLSFFAAPDRTHRVCWSCREKV